MTSRLDKELSCKIANMGFLCACLVVLIHCPISQTHFWYIEHLLKERLTMIAVPCFFMISGFLLTRHVFESGWYLAAIKKRIRSLIVPLLLLDVLWFPVKYGIHYLAVLRFGADDSSEIMKFTLYNVLSGIGIIPWGQAVVVGMWYIKALLLLVLVSPFFKWMVCEGKGRMAISISSIFVAYILQNTWFRWGGVWSYEFNLRCPFYFMLGMALYRYDGLYRVERLKYVASCVAVIGVYCLDKSIAPVMRDVWGTFTTLALTVVIWSFVPTKSWSLRVVGNSFPVFVLHGMILYLLPLPFKVLNVWQDFINVLGPIPICFVVTVLALLIATAIKRYVPRFANLVFGGR